MFSFIILLRGWVLVNLASCMGYWDGLSVARLLGRRVGRLWGGRLAEWSDLVCNSGSEDCAKRVGILAGLPVQEQLGVNTPHEDTLVL